MVSSVACNSCKEKNLDTCPEFAADEMSTVMYKKII